MHNDTENIYNEVNAGTSDPTDGREKYSYLSEYNMQARIEIWLEAIFLIFLLFISLLILFLTWQGQVYSWLNPGLNLSEIQYITVKKYIYYLTAGILGGVTFDLKYLYRVVARGYWHKDRRLWRVMSPFLGMTVAFIVGVLIEANFINAHTTINGPTIVSIGYLSGYFADEAYSKMFEIATVIFGRNSTSKPSSDKKNEK